MELDKGTQMRDFRPEPDLSKEPEDGDCIHEGLDCETNEVCSAGCNCGCASRLVDELTEAYKVRFRNNIKEVVEKHTSVLFSDGSKTEVALDVFYREKVDKFIQELYEAVGVA